MPSVFVSGDIVRRGVVLDNVQPTCHIARLGDLIVEKRPDLNQNFAFYKNKECTEECELTDIVSSLRMANDVYLVYIRPEPVAGEFSPNLGAALFS